jgi:hypothetical protein
MYTIALHFPFFWTGGPAAHARQVRHYIREMRSTTDLTTWEQQYRERQWSFAAQIYADTENQPLAAVLGWRDAESMKIQRGIGGTQGHLWHLRHWRWEEQFSEFWTMRKLSCKVSASVKGLWHSCRDDWLHTVVPQLAELRIADATVSE